MSGPLDFFAALSGPGLCGTYGIGANEMSQDSPPPCQDRRQGHLPFKEAVLSLPDRPSVLDLFCGIGGFALGFRDVGAVVTGIDKTPELEGIFRLNSIGDFQALDLSNLSWMGHVDILLGGPPCRPWSAVNLQRRGTNHRDHELLGRFFEHVIGLEPSAFLMENVPPVGKDPVYVEWLRVLGKHGYAVESRILRYSDYGASTARRRLITVGLRTSGTRTPTEFFYQLERLREPSGTVRDAIGWLEDKSEGSLRDHDWSALKTIDKYRERYDSGQYGWKQLSWAEPAPSFGSVSKTYTLHPSAVPPRVVSVREVLSIMGFSPDFHFPEGIGLSRRYRMVANAVCPLFSRKCAEALQTMIS